jgi:hypothetical protein
LLDDSPDSKPVIQPAIIQGISPTKAITTEEHDEGNLRFGPVTAMNPSQDQPDEKAADKSKDLFENSTEYENPYTGAGKAAKTTTEEKKELNQKLNRRD